MLKDNHNSKKTILITGASQGIGKTCAIKFLKEGYKVRGSLRSMNRKEEVIQALSKEVDTTNNIEFCYLDLLIDDGWNRFEEDLSYALDHKISTNPVLNAFQETVYRYEIDREFIDAFMQSMRWDLSKKVYETDEEYKSYIYGSADVVGLMCLRVFVKGDHKLFKELKSSAMALGSAFQKVNFLRDLKNDFEQLERSYFPGVDLRQLDDASKQKIIAEIESDFNKGLSGIFKLPNAAKFGVYTAYKYYLRLLKKLKRVPSEQIKNKRVRVANIQKVDVLARSYVRYRFNIL